MSCWKLFKMKNLSLNTMLPILNLIWTSLTGSNLLPSAETTFLFVGITLSFCCRVLKNLNDIALIDAPVSNSAAVFNLPICISYSVWKPSMKTSLMMAWSAWEPSSQLGVSSASSVIRFLNSERNWWSLSLKLSSSEDMVTLLTCDFLSWNFFYGEIY